MTSTSFSNLSVRLLHADGINTNLETDLVLEIKGEQQLFVLKLSKIGESNVLHQTVLNKSSKGFQFGEKSFVLKLDDQPITLSFESKAEMERFSSAFNQITHGKQNKLSIFDERTEESSAVQYFQFYGYLSQQQNMMQDYIRTSTYQSAILQNANEFKGKVVLDVGAGTGRIYKLPGSGKYFAVMSLGILSYFAAQAGARKVYAVEASNMGQFAKELAKNNNINDIVQVVVGKIEEVTLPENVDIIISEPMGYMLFNERMLETYLHAKKWLKPGGNMYPTKGDLYVAPFTDDALFMEHFGKSNFWCQTAFYSVDLTSLHQAALQEYFRQPIVDTFDVRILMAKPVVHSTNFLTTQEEQLHKIHIPLHYTMLMTGTLHGLAFWFDVAFLGQTSHVYLSTAPQEPLTHWYQVRCLFPNPLFVRAGQKVVGNVILHANQKQSYDVEMDVTLEGTGVRSTNILDLKNPFFRYTGVQTAPPPGANSQSPTETYWNNAGVVLNGGIMNTSTAYVGQPSHGSGSGGAAYTTQAMGNVMATGGNYGSGQTVQIGGERYVISNQSQGHQYDHAARFGYLSGLSG